MLIIKIFVLAILATAEGGNNDRWKFLCKGKCVLTKPKSAAQLNSDRSKETVEKIAKEYESKPCVKTFSVNEAKNSVYKYTVIPSLKKNQPELPCVVRANITKKSIPDPGTRTSADIPSIVRKNVDMMGKIKNHPQNNNDENGHLIGFQNGGPGKIYNFVPQTRRLNRGSNDNFAHAPSLWYDDENIINYWVRSSGGWAEQTVVVLYDLMKSTRPIAFGTSITLFNSDGTIHQNCIDYFFSNNPDEDSC